MELLRKEPEHIHPYGENVHLFSQETAYRLIEDFTLGFSAPVGNIRHQHLFIPPNLKEEAVALMAEYGYRRLSMSEHNRDRLPKRVPDSDFLGIIIYKRFEMMPLELNKQLIGLSKKRECAIQFGGGYSVIWKVGHVHDETRLPELLRFLKDNHLDYMLPDDIIDPLEAD